MWSAQWEVAREPAARKSAVPIRPSGPTDPFHPDGVASTEVAGGAWWVGRKSEYVLLATLGSSRFLPGRPWIGRVHDQGHVPTIPVMSSISTPAERSDGSAHSIRGEDGPVESLHGAGDGRRGEDDGQVRLDRVAGASEHRPRPRVLADLSLDALQMALWTRRRSGRDLDGLVQHSGKGLNRCPTSVPVQAGQPASQQAAAPAATVLVS
jgi:hypothetical protein